MDVGELYTITGAAREAGISRQSLHHAIRNGLVAYYETADGLKLVELPDVIEYRDRPAGRGRPRTVSSVPRKKRPKRAK